jgi:indolepyruvate ferredoxin oxidoreductase beta subunit
MEAATQRSGSVISSVMFGALAGSAALPFGRQAFEVAIRASGIAVDTNLKGFDEGFHAAEGAVALPVGPPRTVPKPTTATGRRLAARVAHELPSEARYNALHGVQRMMDYQDARYADLYLDRLAMVAPLDRAPFALSAEAARHLALWMSYEDTIRVADLKVRASRIDRVRGEVQVKHGQLMSVTEFMHPRLQEVCETLPAPLGRAILHSERLAKGLGRFFREGRHVRTTGIKWFLLLRILAALRGMRPRSLRFVEEQERIENWLSTVRRAAVVDNGLALELVRCQRLIKGYGDTFERGLRSYRTIMTAYDEGRASSASAIASLCAAALADDKGNALAKGVAA